MTDLRTYIEDLNDLPQEILLGRIVVFTIYDHPVKLSELQKWFQELGLDEAHLPLPNKRHDAFKKATKELDKVSYPMSGNRTGILLCRDVSSTNDYIIRSIVREIRDSARNKLTHIEAIRCIYHRSNHRLGHQVREDVLEPDEAMAIYGYARRLHERYEYHAEFLDNMKVRGVVREYLKSLNCVEIKPGVYYVNCNRDEELHRLAELVNRIGGGCHMNMIPIVNIQREREFLSRCFEREAADQLQGVTRDIRALLEERKSISPAAYAKMKARFIEITKNAEEHMLTLDVSQDLTAANAVAAHRALQQLEERMLSDD